MTDQTPEPSEPMSTAGDWPPCPDEVGSGVAAVYGDPAPERGVRYPPRIHVVIDEVEALRARQGEYERLIAEGRMAQEIPLGDITLDPDEEAPS